MTALGVVVESEYLRRVKSKTFILMTLLMPIAIVAIIAVVVLVVSASVSSERSLQRVIAVYDPGDHVFEYLAQEAPSSIELERVRGSLDSLRQRVTREEFDGLLVFPDGLTDMNRASEVYLYTTEVQSVLVQQVLRRFVLDVVRERRLESFELPREVYNAISRGVAFRVMELDESGEADRDASGRAVGLIGYGMGIAFGIFMLVSIYGGMVMQAVMEEKTSRMAEILVATVRPFEILMGKILALFAVAVTQIVMWLLMILVLGVAAAVLVGLAFTPEQLGDFAGAAQSLQNIGTADSVAIPDIRGDVVFVTILMIPIGYFLYASLFGALGAVFENNQEAQMAVMLPMFPLILSVVMLQTIALAPNSLFIKIGSLVPFTAPVILPTRMLLSDVPVLEVALSLLLALFGAIATGWVAGRIFRVGLLRYGKKTSMRDLIRMAVSA